MPIPFIDLAAQQRHIKEKIDANIQKVLAHGRYIMGPEIIELEEELASFCGCEHSITCGSGTDALLLALMAWGVQAGDAVFVPSFSFFASAEVISLLGATPVFVDVLPDTFNIDPAQFEKAVMAVQLQDARVHPLPATALQEKLTPKAIITVDLFGQPADYAALLPIAAKYRIKVLEDAAQGFGGSTNNAHVCNLGCDAAATSFFPAKPLGCYGDGGAVFTNDELTANIIKSLRVHGKGKDKYDNVRIGLNARMDTLQAAIVLPKLEIFSEELIKRQQVADWYDTYITEEAIVVKPVLISGNASAWAQYSILCNDADHRARLQAVLKDAGIPTMVYYETPLPFLAVYAELDYSVGDFPVAEDLSTRIVSLPMHPYLTEEDVARIGSLISTIK